MAATGGLHRPMNRVAEGPGTGPVTYLGPLPGEGGVVGFAALGHSLLDQASSSAQCIAEFQPKASG